jgi:hypothetical protein
MVEVAEVTEVAQHRRAVPGLPVVARGEAMAGAVSWVTADLIWTDQPIYNTRLTIRINRLQHLVLTLAVLNRMGRPA